MDQQQVNQDTEAAFRNIYKRVREEGKLCSPRGQPVIECENFAYELPAYVRFPSFMARKYSEPYVKNELLWYLRGNRKDQTILKHAKMWTELVNNDGTINSNYGQYIFGSPAWREQFTTGCQFDAVIEVLKKDKDSRRASIVILAANHLLMQTNDVPCTYSMNFRIRENKLNISVHMRSQDAMFGMGNDAPAFSMFHEMVFVTLRDTAYPDLQLGSYFHTADSFHVYERHFEMLEQIISGDMFFPIECPAIKNYDEVKHLRGTIHLTYKDGKEAVTFPAVHEASLLLTSNSHLIPNIKGSMDWWSQGFAFSEWLLSGALEAEKKEAALSEVKP